MSTIIILDHYVDEEQKDEILIEYEDLISTDLNYREVKNGSKILYLPQNNDFGYSNMFFGKGSVGSSGGSLACLSMAINSLKYNDLATISDADIFITPGDLILRLEDKFGDRDFFYLEEKSGQSNDLIKEISNIYDLDCNYISKDSCIEALKNGSMIIARVTKSIFTETGNFILICGYREFNDKILVNVIDPNNFNRENCYKLFSLDYLENANAIFFEISKKV